MAQDAYVTMLFSDSYLQGAQVLAASLRDGHTSKKLAVIVPSDEAHRLLPQTISQLEESFDFVFPMPTFRSTNFANLRLLERPDLALSLTKINLWRLVQFRKCVYLDADVLALRAPDELFSLDTDFAAAPDVGWPDIFNSGVFLFKPNMATYYALKALADSGITFDGGDQGLLNTFFPAYHRLSFTYNVTPSTNYQYTPAYRHFSSNISLFHFIGRTKPWDRRSYGQDSFNEASGRWWSVYEKHYGWKIREDELRKEQEAALNQQERDFTPRQTESYHQPVYHQQEQQHYYPPRVEPSGRPSTPDKAKKQVSFGSTDTTFFHPTAAPELTTHLPSSYHPLPPSPPPPPPPRQPYPPPFEPKMVTWDPARSAPPPDSGPEAKHLAISSYESAWDKPYNPNEQKWVPPPRSPLPRGYEYTPPAAPPSPTPAAPPPAHQGHDPSSDEESEVEVPEPSGYHTSDSESPEGGVGKYQERVNPVFPWEMKGQRQVATRVFPGDLPAKGKDPVSEAYPTNRRPSLEKYEFSNAWDSLPIIQSYVKQKLGETPAPPATSPKPKVESPTTTPSVPKSVLATATVVSATEGERWDPNKQLDKLRGTVINKLREQQAKKQTESTKEGDEPPAQPISADDGN